MKIEYRNPKELKPYEKNAKRHPQEQIRLIRNSIERFKMDQPIVIDKKGVIIKGEGRRLAAIELGLEAVPVIVRNDLSEEEKRIARLADNRSAESMFDIGILSAELEDLKVDFNPEDFGFSEDYLEFLKELEAPVYEPKATAPTAHKSISPQDISDAKRKLASLYEKDDRQQVQIVCPYCEKEFYLWREDVKDLFESECV